MEYQQGTLAGYEVREYLLAKWGRTCAYCGASGVPLNLDHIHPRSRGGSDRISNLPWPASPVTRRRTPPRCEEFLKDKPALLAKILRQAKAPLRDAAAVNATRWALWRALEAPPACPCTPPPAGARSGTALAPARRSRTRWTRCTSANCETVTAWPSTVLVVTATGRGTYARTTPDRYGFPRLVRPRIKLHHGFQTGDLVRANVPAGKKAGVHAGRVLVRSSGSFDITTRHGRITGINHRHVRHLQRADGYGYTTHPEARHRTAFPPRPEDGGIHAGGI